MSGRFSTCCPARRGLTLVEVVVGLTLLAALAVGVLLAVGAHRRQLQTAENRLAAADVADQLLASWYSSGTGIPRSSSGRLTDAGRDWHWRTQVVEQGAVEIQPVEVIRLEVRKQSLYGQLSPSLAAVEVLAPLPFGTAGKVP